MKKLNTSTLKEMGKSFAKSTREVVTAKETYAGVAIGLIITGGLDRSLRDNIKQAASGIAFSVVVNGIIEIAIDRDNSKNEEVLTED